MGGAKYTHHYGRMESVFPFALSILLMIEVRVSMIGDSFMYMSISSQ